MWENTPPFGAFGLTYSKCLKSGGYLSSPKAEIPRHSVSWPASTFCTRDDTRAAAPRRSASRRVCSRALVIEAFASALCSCAGGMHRYSFWRNVRAVYPPSRLLFLQVRPHRIVVAALGSREI